MLEWIVVVGLVWWTRETLLPWVIVLAVLMLDHLYVSYSASTRAAGKSAPAGQWPS